MNRLAASTAILLFAAIVLGPCAFLILDTAHSNSAPPLSLDRLTPLFLRSLALAAPVALAAYTLSIALASFVASRWERPILVSAIAALLLPPHVHLVAWAKVLDRIEAIGGGASPLGGWGASAWIQAMCFAPFAIAAVLLGARLVDGRRIDAARTLGDDATAFRRVAIPLLRPYAAAGAALCFLMSLLDFTIPSHYQWNVLSLEIFSDFSAFGDAGRAALLSVPLAAASLLAVAVSLIPHLDALRSVAPASPPAPFVSSTPGMKFLRIMALGAFGLMTALPLVTLLATAWPFREALTAMAGARREVATTILQAGAAGFLSILIAVGPARCLVEGGLRRGFALLVVLPSLVLPAPLAGIALIAATREGPIALLYGSSALPAWAATVRFAPWAVLLLAAHFSRRHELLLDAARLSPAPVLRTFLKIRLPLAAPGLAAAALLVFALASGELGATLLVAPAGSATLTMRVYNYIHYGASSAVAGLALFSLGLVLLPMLVGSLVQRRLS